MVCFKTEADSSNKSSQVGETSATQQSKEAALTEMKPNTRVGNVAAVKVTANVAQQRDSRVLLATAVIIIEDDHGGRHTARALLDSGSECNFVSERLCKQMHVAKERVEISVVGIGAASVRVKHTIRVNIRSRNSTFTEVMDFLVLPKLTSKLPTATVQTMGWVIPQEIELADPSFFVSNSVDIILGIQSFFGFFRTGKAMSLGEGLPRLTESVFGWIVSGEAATLTNSTQITCNIAISDKLEEMMERFWSCEEVGDTHNYSPEERRCEEHFSTTVHRGSDGRYTVSLPKNEDILARLGESKDIALKRFVGLERRLSRDENLRKQYHEFISEYLELDHMCKIVDDGTPGIKRCFLPHHPVVKEESTTTKLRVVFDASCRTSTGISVNEALLVGPVIQQDLRSIVLRCRMRQIMLVSDVEKMFRQIRINPADAPLQSILWQFREEDEVETYELKTVTYGTKPAPFLATRTLKQLAIDEAERYPLAANVIENDVYMDDVITGADDVETATRLRLQLDAMLESGGFRLRKWASNCVAVLKDIPKNNLALPEALPKSDTLRFSFVIPELAPDQTLTKRKVLSIIASLFDPLGLLGATITKAKIFMQRLWSAKNTDGRALEWDSPPTETLEADWRIYHQQLALLNELRIPRCVIASAAASVQIHCFSDASERAYGGCVYVRSMDANQLVTVKLLTAKSKVAPLKTQSLPRLELCGARLVAELWEKVTEPIGPDYEVHFWTDSTCVLRWIQASPGTWVTYIANRVSKIQAITEEHTWHHVPGLSNPADLISRGVTPEVLIENRAPRFGGLWEAAVRSAKYHLLRVIGGNPVSTEDFITLLTQVEACLNSRPLTPISDDPTDLEPLTPAHFLTGGSLQAIPEPDYSAVPLNRLNQYQLVQRQLQDFWKRWKSEYLVQLQSRTKNWERPVKVEIGRLVVVMDANQPPMRWKLGRISQLHPGTDEVVRVVTVKTATGSFTRPVEKLCFLPQVEDATGTDQESCQ
ncbi:uncharacterized protein LOC129719987 [Wyeomyia smithii]|uniref:uncharacterized protein LOC129719987 n=1 Tax=Wyeomyia smithii TaxID=174621 RepID=UPI002467B270|nr:uncharacterized protein LOC129719987 [Wyeomyia smithii]